MSLETEKVQVNFTDMNIPASVSNFRPEVYKDGECYICVLAPGTAHSIYGEGDTLEAALDAWDKAYHEKSGK